MEKIKFVPLTFGSDTKTYVRADTIVELSEDGDKTSVYISNSDVPIKVKESVGEILAKIRGTAWEQAPIDRIEPGTDGNAYRLSISNGKEFEQQSSEDCISRANALRVAKNEYLRGWHNALCKALSEKYSIHCEEGNLSVIQEETITGLGLSMDCAVGKDVESYMGTIPSVIPKGVTVTDFADKCRECGKMKNGKWIPVSEKLPEDFQRVLVTVVNYDGDKVVRVAVYYDLKNKFKIQENNESWIVGEEGLLAWRPIPEPYQEEKE